jgi:dTDP-4-dehydrorhamnose reductase
MIGLSETKNEISVVNDQVGSPTYTVDLAKLLVDMAETDKYGLYLATNEGYMSWYDFAKLIFEVMGIEMKVNPVSTENYLASMDKKIAERPMNSKLDKQKLVDNGFELLPTVRDALERYREELVEANVLVERK